MFVDLPQPLIPYAAGAFVLGWLLSSIASDLGARYRAKRCDPRDDRIRELEAELRVARGNSERSRTALGKLEAELEQTLAGLGKRDAAIAEQRARLQRAESNLRESVLKTHQLRAELAERVTENVHAEARIREVETELSVAQASSDMIATGVLDYRQPPGKEDDDARSAGEEEAADVSGSAP
ncbi:MAG: hypothetical protein MJA32_12385 [Proteobacteria bacterium]|nr:hypothetical protein [Pseudomonadota bacterium]